MSEAGLPHSDTQGQRDGWDSKQTATGVDKVVADKVDLNVVDSPSFTHAHASSSHAPFSFDVGPSQDIQLDPTLVANAVSAAQNAPPPVKKKRAPRKRAQPPVQVAQSNGNAQGDGEVPVAGPSSSSLSQTLGKKPRRPPRKIDPVNLTNTDERLAALTVATGQPVLSAREIAQNFNGSATNPFPCPYDGCTKRFARKSDFIRHYRVHTQERPFRCAFPECGKTFIQAAALTVHERVHTGEKPLVCGVEGCQVSFADASSLARHKYTVHTTYRPFVCGKCGTHAFTRKTDMLAHEEKCGTEAQDSIGDWTEQQHVQQGSQPQAGEGGALVDLIDPSLPSGGVAPAFDNRQVEEQEAVSALVNIQGRGEENQ